MHDHESCRQTRRLWWPSLRVLHRNVPDEEAGDLLVTNLTLNQNLSLYPETPRP